jgi:hypothetical protein
MHIFAPVFAATDPVENCARYCGFVGCACDPSVEECDALCERD